MRILVGALVHESNTFFPQLTRRDDFDVRLGGECLRAGPQLTHAFGGLVETLVDADVKISPSLAARAVPGGIVSAAAYDEFCERIIAAADGCAGACLHLHGAMRAEGEDYCEAALLKRLRAKLGPEAAIIVSLDLHANLSRSLVDSVDGLVCYRTAPHVDTFETGQRAAQLMLAVLRDGANPKPGFTALPWLLPGERSETTVEPLRSIMQRIAVLEETPGILSASLALGHPWADVPHITVSTVVISDGDEQLAQHHADALAGELWSRRDRFEFSEEAASPEEVCERARRSSVYPVFLSDSGDNPGAGGSTDRGELLAHLLGVHELPCLFASLKDGAAVAACFDAGVGAELTPELGAEAGAGATGPVRCRGTVIALHDDDDVLQRLYGPGGGAGGGPVAVFQSGSVTIVLTSARLNVLDPEQLRAIGVDAARYRIVAIKRGYLTAALQRIAARSILALTRGYTDCRLERLPYRRLERPVFPLDPDMEIGAGG